ncbi:MAG: hypothetical protein Ct9H300mP25_05560 [Acidobacteriota bacterium]|nr:MAG: hypothetical protein Ct9H300mP25_05560 [Acidobacteriota bacterium]
MYRSFRMSFVTAGVFLAWLMTVSLQAQQANPQWDTIEPELLRHFQTLLRMDTSDPPGKEQPAADYVAEILQRKVFRFRCLLVSLGVRMLSHGLRVMGLVNRSC